MKRHPSSLKRWQRKRGIVAVLAMIFLFGFAAMLAIGVDAGRMVSTQTSMQNAADAAALAAANELIGSVRASSEEGAIVINENSGAVSAAREVAREVAEMNGFDINPETDVRFGRRGFDAQSGEWPIIWDQAPYNVVRVTIDESMSLAFGWAVGRDEVPLSVRAAAFVQARDMVLTLDFSTSMNDDSQIKSIPTMGLTQIEDNLQAMWDALQDADPKFPNTGQSKFPAQGWAQVNSSLGTYFYASSTRNSTVNYVFQQLGLDETVNGKPKYPFPQAGRNSNGTSKNSPSRSYSDARWKDYIKHVIYKSRTSYSYAPYKYRFGFHTLMDYLLEKRYDADYSEDLWRTPHYPFHAVKQGATLFTQFLHELDYGDQLGLVSYGTTARREDYHRDDEVTIDISDDPITEDYATINELQVRKRAGEYSSNTGMGYGIKEARLMLLGTGGETYDGHARIGSKPTIIVMTDGNANQYPRNWRLPNSFDWDDWTDYDGDGNADYYYQYPSQTIRILRGDHRGRTRSRDSHHECWSLLRYRLHAGHGLCGQGSMDQCSRQLRCIGDGRPDAGGIC